MNWKNQIVVLVGIKAASAAYSQRPQPPIPVESIRQDLFLDSDPKSSCARVFPQKIPSSAKIVLEQLLSSIRTKDAEQLKNLFHPRLKMTKLSMGQALTRMHLGLQQPLEVSLHRFWALQNLDNVTHSLSCPYSTEMLVYPQYGYPMMFGVWIQLLGQQDLGRLFVTMVPRKNRWVLGGFHYIRWSYHSHSYEHLLQRGEQQRLTGDAFGARMWFNLASKFLDGKGLYELPIREEIKELGQKTMSSQQWLAELQKVLPGYKVRYASSLFTVDGFGLLIRTETVEKAGESLTKKCQDIINLIQSKNPVWWAGVDGVRCSYILKQEDHRREGHLGYIYLPTKS